MEQNSLEFLTLEGKTAICMISVSYITNNITFGVFVSELQEFIYRRIRISALPYLPLSIVLLLISAGILYFLFSFDKPVTIPRIFLVFPIMFPIIAIWLIYQWFLTLNLKKHPLVNLLFENPSDIQKIIILKNEFPFVYSILF